MEKGICFVALSIYPFINPLMVSLKSLIANLQKENPQALVQRIEVTKSTSSMIRISLSDETSDHAIDRCEVREEGSSLEAFIPSKLNAEGLIHILETFYQKLSRLSMNGKHHRLQ